MDDCSREPCFTEENLSIKTEVEIKEEEMESCEGSLSEVVFNSGNFIPEWQSLQVKNEVLGISVKDESLDFNDYEKEISDCDLKNVRSPSVKQENVMADHLDTEVLIVEVQKRPMLWDSSTEDYKDKNRKVEAWAEVCHSLVEDFDEKSNAEKSNIGKEVQARWKSIRDAYARDCKKRNNESKLGSRAVKSRRYIFAEQLSFLRKVIRNRTMTNSLSSSQDTGEASEETSQDCTRQSVICPGSSEKRKRISLEDRMIKFMEGHQQQKEDDDKDFFMSILPTVRTLNEDNKIEFRLQVMQALRNIKAGQYGAPSIPGSQGFLNP